ncbi:hypothetical protein IT568_04690 [bacterium]|nr:hypothetical protein [bacterium]
MKPFKSNLMEAYKQEKSKENQQNLKQKIIKSVLNVVWFFVVVLAVVFALQYLKDTKKQDFFKEPEKPLSQVRSENKPPEISNFLTQKEPDGKIKVLGVVSDDAEIRSVLVNQKQAKIVVRGGITNFEVELAKVPKEFLVIVTDDEGEVTSKVFTE